MMDKMGMLAEMLKKKGSASDEGDSMSPEFKAAKLGVLKDLHKHMGSMIGGDMGVTVAAPDKASLAMGLDKAKSMLPDAIESKEDPTEEASESSDMETSEGDEDKDPEQMTTEELSTKIQELQAIQKQKMMKV